MFEERRLKTREINGCIPQENVMESKEDLPGPIKRAATVCALDRVSGQSSCDWGVQLWLQGEEVIGYGIAWIVCFHRPDRLM